MAAPFDGLYIRQIRQTLSFQTEIHNFVEKFVISMNPVYAGGNKFGNLLACSFETFRTLLFYNVSQRFVYGFHV
jgi:hypothetical protein